MTPGPTIIRKCSACGKLIGEHTIGSGNTFGAKFWTDGKREAPMLPDQPWLVKCPHCSTLVWIDEQEQVGEMEPWGPCKQNDSGFHNARPFAVPSLQDYLCAIRSTSDARKERYLRLRTWWAGNDSRRQGAATPLSDDESANIAAFAALLDESDENDRIMKAEVMRELGNYEDALALLSHPFREELVYPATIIKGLAQQKTPFVQEMTRE